MEITLVFTRKDLAEINWIKFLLSDHNINEIYLNDFKDTLPLLNDNTILVLSSNTIPLQNIDKNILLEIN